MKRLLSVRRLVVVAVVAALTAVAVPVWSAVRSPLAGEVVGFLLLGSDAGPMRGDDPLSGRADAFHVVFARTDGSSAVIMDLPRDSWVTVPGRGDSKLNTCLLGGPDRCVETIEQNFGVSLDGYVITSFTGYMAAIDALGGVVMDVPHVLDDGGPRVEPGPDQRLSGAQALTWARDRKHREGGDFARTEAQGQLVRALHEQLRDRASNPYQLARLARDVHRTTVTSFDGTTWLKLGLLAVGMEPSAVTQHPLPGEVGWAGKQSVVYLTDEAFRIVKASADGRP